MAIGFASMNAEKEFLRFDAGFAERTSNLVTPDSAGKWIRYVWSMTEKNERMIGIVRLAAAVMLKLSIEPRISPKEAWVRAGEQGDFRIPIPHSMQSAKLVIQFHERGEEFSGWYTVRYRPEMDLRRAARDSRYGGRQLSRAYTNGFRRP